MITDYSPTFGMDRDPAHPARKSLNVITGLGYTFGAIKELNAKIGSQSRDFESLRARVASLSLTVDGLLRRSPASSSTAVTVTSGADILSTLANAVLTKVQNLWATGDIIA